ncbi:MAG: hypothetical protein ABI348_07590 [Nitrososphaera sp.]|jgi:hypothetical protein
MPIFAIDALVEALAALGYACKAGARSDIRPDRWPYYERWLQNRDGFVTMESGHVDFIGIEEVVRMGPFFNVYCLVGNDSLSGSDDNAHNLLDASPYFDLHRGRPKNLGWSGGVLSNLLAKDAELSAELAKNIMKEECKRINIRAHNYCCVVETSVWDPDGLASVFGIMDRAAMHARKLMKQVHFGENEYV